jgi:hypothetical protein
VTSYVFAGAAHPFVQPVLSAPLLLRALPPHLSGAATPSIGTSLPIPCSSIPQQETTIWGEDHVLPSSILVNYPAVTIFLSPDRSSGPVQTSNLHARTVLLPNSVNLSICLFHKLLKNSDALSTDTEIPLSIYNVSSGGQTKQPRTLIH